MYPDQASYQKQYKNQSDIKQQR